ncbi:hypothetical protein ACP70R_018170 [Stipagrostis hirtigluma subsp. patula]
MCYAPRCKFFLPFDSNDVHAVFGTPSKGSNVTGVGNETSNGVREFARKCLGMTSVGDDIVASCVRVIEFKDKSPMTELDKDAFALALVCLIIFKLLVPVDLLDGLTAKFIPALVCRETIASYNWSQYVVDRILCSSNIVKADPKATIVSKHVYPFLQIFYCDNTDFGKKNTSHTLFPRIKAFGNSTIRLLMSDDALSDDGDGIIKYVRRKVRNDIETKSLCSQVDNSIYHSPKGSDVSLTPSAGDMSINQASSTMKIMPHASRSDRTKENRERAWFIKTMLALRRTVEKRMANFCQEIVETLDTAHTNSSGSIAKSSANDGLVQKSSKYRANKFTNFLINLKENNKDVSDHQVSFKSSALLESIAQLVNWMMTCSDDELDRKWIIHPLPRLIELTGLKIRDEIIMETEMSPDIFDAITRIYMQLYTSLRQNGVMERMRWLMESDYAGRWFSGRYDHPDILTQVTECRIYSEMACTDLVLVPARINGCWCCFGIDFLKKELVVYDPLSVVGSACCEYNQYAIDICESFYSSVSKYMQSRQVEINKYRLINFGGNLKEVESNKSGMYVLKFMLTYTGVDISGAITKM